MAILGLGHSAKGAAFRWVSNYRLSVENQFNNSQAWQLIMSRYFRDASAWYHIVAAIDTTQGTASNRVKIYINGVQETQFDTANYPSQNYENLFLYDNARLGAWDGNGYYAGYNGYLAEYHAIDGQQLTASDFGETDPVTGAWKPKKYTGTYGTNGHYLNFSDNSNTTSSTLGKDYSGNGKNFTPNNMSVSAGAGNDCLEDSPTNNFCVFNELLSSSYSTLSQCNLTSVGNTSSDNGNDRASFSMKTGKWYAEFQITGTAATYPQIGVVHVRDADRPNNAAPQAGYSSSMLFGSLSGAYFADGDKQINNSSSSFGNSFTTNDIIGVAFDADNGAVYFSKNGTFQNSGDPTSGGSKTGALLTWTPSSTIEHYMSVANYNGSGTHANFGQRAFSYTPPTNYKKLSSQNISDPTIDNPKDHFDLKLWTGTGSSHNITGYEFQPDWVWVKKRSGSEVSDLQDAVRGATKRMSSVNGDAESTISGSINSFNSDGFTVVDAGTTNESGHTYVGWAWNGGGSTVTNSTGSRTAQVRANATAGFSIGTFTAQSSGSATVGHGLGVAPQVVMTKSRTLNSNWYVYTEIVGENGWVLLDGTASATTGNGAAFGTAPTSTVFTYGSGLINQGDILFYAFASIEGYSKFGSYTGNSSTDGPFVYTGFKPSLFITRRIDGGSNWYMWDSKRRYNPNNAPLQANDAGGEATGYDNSFDILSNGFKSRASNAATNSNGDKYIYFAWAESPFKYARGE